MLSIESEVFAYHIHTACTLQDAVCYQDTLVVVSHIYIEQNDRSTIFINFGTNQIISKQNYLRQKPGTHVHGMF